MQNFVYKSLSYIRYTFKALNYHIQISIMSQFSPQQT